MAGLVGEPAEVAQKLVERFAGVVDRVGPIVHSAGPGLLGALLRAIRSAQGD